MNRRGFLGLLAATPVIAIAPELLELLAPKRTIFLPPRGGWPRDMSRYFTSKDAWYLRTEDRNGLKTFYRTRLSEDSLEAMLIAVKRQADMAGIPVAIRPTRLIVHPSWTREQVEQRLAIYGSEGL